MDNEIGQRCGHPTIPSAEHYGASYLGQRGVRLHSYQHQVGYTLQSGARSVLVVGKGDGFVVQLLEAAGIRVRTLDITPDLKPDVVATVTSIPFGNEAFDTSICCQVLEHLPFSELVPSLSELRRVSRGHLIFSVPDNRRFISLRGQFFSAQIDMQASVPLRNRPLPPDRFELHGHYWEIGFGGVSARLVSQALRQSGWRLLQKRRVPDLPWHSFFFCSAAAGPHP